MATNCQRDRGLQGILALQILTSYSLPPPPLQIKRNRKKELTYTADQIQSTPYNALNLVSISFFIYKPLFTSHFKQNNEKNKKFKALADGIDDDQNLIPISKLHFDRP